jgi:cell wall-associated NlpC family hydrolase
MVNGGTRMNEWSDVDTSDALDEFLAAAKPPTGLETIKAQLARDLAAVLRALDEAGGAVGPQPGDILLIRATNFWGRVVERVTHSPYGHCAMLVDPGILIESINRDGVRLTPVSTYTGDWYRAADAPPGTQAAAIRAAVSRIGQPYGWGEAAHDWNRLLFGKLSPVDCSGLIAWAYREAGYPLTRRPYPTPGDLAWCETLTPLGYSERRT